MARLDSPCSPDTSAKPSPLPEIERVEPPVVAMEARLCMMAGEWGRGLKRAYLCEFADGDDYKIAAAEFYAAYAGHLCAGGDVEKAKFYVGEAAKVFPEIRMQMLDDPALGVLFGSAE